MLNFDSNTKTRFTDASYFKSRIEEITKLYFGGDQYLLSQQFTKTVVLISSTGETLQGRDGNA